MCSVNDVSYIFIAPEFFVKGRRFSAFGEWGALSVGRHDEVADRQKGPDVRLDAKPMRSLCDSDE